ncbi:MAG: thioredoxin family protein [Candidatus Thorarchaeota archaeon]
MFRSSRCTFCDVLMSMISDELEPGLQTHILEVDVDEHKDIAQEFGVVAVPTLVSSSSAITGLPDQKELQVFFLRAACEGEKDVTEASAILQQAISLRKSHFRDGLGHRSSNHTRKTDSAENGERD